MDINVAAVSDPKEVDLQQESKQPTRKPRLTRRWWRWLILLAILSCGAYLLRKGRENSQSRAAQGAAKTVVQFEGAIKADQALIDNARLQLIYCHITAPISGRIGLRLVDAGNMVHANDPNGIVVVTQVQPIAVLFTLPEDSLPPVLKKLRARERLPVDAYDRSGMARIARGALLTVDNQIDPNTGTLRLKAVFKNQDNTLFPNQFVNVKQLIDVK